MGEKLENYCGPYEEVLVQVEFSQKNKAMITMDYSGILSVWQHDFDAKAEEPAKPSSEEEEFIDDDVIAAAMLDDVPKEEKPESVK